MYFDVMELKAHYEFKKEEMEKAVLASKYLKNSREAKLYSNFLSLFKKSRRQKKLGVQKPNCCQMQIQKVCCQN